jgi:hypothetical protein
MVQPSDFLEQIVYMTEEFMTDTIPTTDFASNLKANLEAQPRLRFRGRRLLAFLNTPDSPEKQQRLLSMENHSKVHLGMAHQTMVAIDWSKIDWMSILEGLLKFLLAILPMFL